MLDLETDRPHPLGWARCLPSERRSRPAGQWNHYRIACIDGAVKLSVNGKEVSGGRDVSPRKGYICLESEGSEVHFRNIRIRELPPSRTPLEPGQVAALDEGFRSLYTGVDLAGWKLGKGDEGRWKANDWRIDFDGEGGPIWSEEEFRDFVLIVDWRWTGKPLKRQAPAVLPGGGYDLDGDGKHKMVDIDDAGRSGIRLTGSEKSGIDIWC